MEFYGQCHARTNTAQIKKETQLVKRHDVTMWREMTKVGKAEDVCCCVFTFPTVIACWLGFFVEGIGVTSSLVEKLERRKLVIIAGEWHGIAWTLFALFLTLQTMPRLQRSLERMVTRYVLIMLFIVISSTVADCASLHSFYRAATRIAIDFGLDIFLHSNRNIVIVSLWLVKLEKTAEGKELMDGGDGKTRPEQLQWRQQRRRNAVAITK